MYKYNFFNKYYLYLTPNFGADIINYMKKTQKDKKVFKLLKYLLKYKLLSFCVPLFKGLEAATEIFIPMIMANIIDIGIANRDIRYILTFAAIILGLNVIGIIFSVIGTKCSAVSTESMARDMRSDLFTHINSLSHKELDNFSTTGLLNRTVHDVHQLKNGTASLLRTFIRIPFLLIGSLVMAISINLKLSLIFIIVCPLLLLSVVMIMKKISPLLQASKEKLDKTSNITRENLTGVRVVRAFNKQNFEAERFQTSNYDLINTQLKLGVWAAALVPIIYTIINFAIVAILYFGGIEVNIGGMSQGNLIAFINYFNQIASSMVAIARLITIFTRMGTSSKRINEVLSLKNSITDPKNPINFDPSNPKMGEVEFKNVSFSYNMVKDAISNLNLKVNAGETIGIIGGTGSGKSSIINLIPRFYDCTKGSVLIGGNNIKKYKVSDLRKIIGIVPQNPTLFDGTIASNMRWRNPNASPEEITKALKISQSYDFVKEYSDFLDHKVNRGGSNFSGGQKQRLTIARAIVDNPQILILDDSTSALDFSTDAKLRKSIKHMLNCTTFIVTQRTNSIKDADKIVVLESGKVVDIGTHEELLSRCDVYSEIHYSQNNKEGK